jgi:hypothetical protein
MKLDNNTWGELLIKVVENFFYLYDKMEQWFNMYHDNLFKDIYYIFNPIIYLKSIGYNMYIAPSFKHISSRDRGEIFRLAYSDITRRV